ncbi:MAG: IS630 family transposase, partial [Bacteroidota bacterium]
YVKITEGQLAHLETLRELTNDKKIYIRYTIIIMWGKEFTYGQIAKALGIGTKTVQRAVKVYVRHGSEQLAIYKYVGRSNSLETDQIKELEIELQSNLYAKASEVKAWILKRFDVEMSVSSVTKLMKKLGFVYKKAKVHPGKANGINQQNAIASMKRLMSRKSSDTKVFFIDGTHPVYNTEPCYGWIKKGKDYPIPSNTGRKRVNKNGAIDAEDSTNVCVDYTESVNAQSTIRLLEQILESQVEAKRIYIYSDNAKYYRSKVLQEWLKSNKRIKWKYLPPYAPNLNLIERMWGFMKREKIKGYYYETFGEFRQQIESFFDNLEEYKEALNTLMAFKFQVISWD